MIYTGALIMDENQRFIIRYTRSMYSLPLASGSKMEIKTSDGWKKTRLCYNRETGIWYLEGLPHRKLAGLIVRTEEVL